MGNNLPAADTKTLKDFEDNYRDNGEQIDMRYGKFNLWVEKHPINQNLSKGVISKVFEYTSKDDFLRVFQKLKNREELRSPHLCKVYGVINITPDSICGTYYALRFLYEYCSYDLEADISKRERVSDSNPEKVLLLR